MSRRRSSDGPGWADINLPGKGWERVSVVCTGRGTHRRREFGWVWVPPRDMRDSERVRTEQLRQYWEFFQAEDGGPEGVARQRSRTIGFRCTVCVRNFPILKDRFSALVTACADEGVRSVDISAPPATLGGNSI